MAAKTAKAKKAAPKKAAKKAAKPAKKAAAKKPAKKGTFAKAADKTGKTLRVLAAELRGVMKNVQKPKGDLKIPKPPPARKK